MRTLSLMRHGKSSWDFANLCDFERPLNKRGEESVPLIARYLEKKNMTPDLILCSAARRTRQTLKYLRETIKLECEIQFLEELYLISQKGLLHIIKALPKNKQNVLIIGHNPTLHTLSLDLIKTANPKDLRALSEKFPTAGLSVFHFEASTWADVSLQSGTLKHFITPKMLLAQQQAA